MIERDVQIEAPENWVLHGTLFQSSSADAPQKSGPSVLISGAAAVPHRYYRRFARFLVEQGAAAVLTYDYRGIGESSGDRTRWRSLRMKDWALLDFPSAAAFLKAAEPRSQLVGLGHSYGGQALGLNGTDIPFERYCAVATMSGYWGDLDTPWSVWWKTQVLGRTIAKVLGYVPKAFSPGEAMPGGVMTDWARWIADPVYFFSDPDLPETLRFQEVELPYLSVRLEDDPWGNTKAVEGFMERYENADLRHRVLRPGESGPIGHLGFFRKEHRDTHWPIVSDFLMHGFEPDGPISIDSD